MDVIRVRTILISNPLGTLSSPSIARQSPTGSSGTDTTPTFRVTVDSSHRNGKVQLFPTKTDNICTGTPLSSEVTVDAAYEDVTTNELAVARHDIYAKHTDRHGRSACSSRIRYTVVQGAPAAPTVALQSPGTSDRTPTIRVTVDSSQQNGKVQLFKSRNCTGNTLSGKVGVDAAYKDVEVTTALELQHCVRHLCETHQHQ